MKRLSVIVPSLDGQVPEGLRRQLDEHDDVELVVVAGVSPVGRARNLGLERATGEYLAWVDADDEVEAEWLEKILGACAQSPDVMVIGHRWMTTPTFGFERVWRGGDLLFDVLAQRNIKSELWNFIIRRELWQGVRFDDAARILEDWEVIPLVLAKAKRVVPIAECLYIFRAREGSITHRVDASSDRESFERAVARLGQVERLALPRRYRRAAFASVGRIITAIAIPPEGAVRWVRRHLLSLLLSPSTMRLKARCVLAAIGKFAYSPKGNDGRARPPGGPPRPSAPTGETHGSSMVHVVLAADANYLPGLEVTRRTILENCRAPERLVWHVFGERDLAQLNVGAFAAWNCGSKMTYLRLFLPELLPGVDRVIYSDVDTIWRRDICELWDEVSSRGEEKSIWWVRDFRSIATHPDYGCAGVCVMNLKRLGEFGLAQKAIEYVRANGTPPFVDQGLLNILLKDDCGVLPSVWNAMGDCSNLPTEMKRCVFHITGIGRHFHDAVPPTYPPQYALWWSVYRREQSSRRLLRYWFLARLWPLRVFAALLPLQLRERIIRQLFFAKVYKE